MHKRSHILRNSTSRSYTTDIDGAFNSHVTTITSSCSWHEIGIRDLPAMIDHALEITGEEKMFYLGHSQGTTAFFVMASQLPEYQSKIQTMFAMAPIAYCGRMPSPIMQLMAKLAGTMNVRDLHLGQLIIVRLR